MMARLGVIEILALKWLILHIWCLEEVAAFEPDKTNMGLMIGAIFLLFFLGYSVHFYLKYREKRKFDLTLDECP